MKKYILFMLICCLFSSSAFTGNAEGDALNTVSRAELSSQVMSTYEYVTQMFTFPTFARAPFDDIGFNSPYQLRIEQVYALHIMNGSEERIFNPNGIVTREQAATVLYRLSKAIANDLNIDFTDPIETTMLLDEEELSVWAKESVNYVIKNNLMQCSVSGNFLPKEEATQEDISVALNKIKNQFVDGDDTKERIDFYEFQRRIQNK